jgi:hypothetical protein
MELAAVREMLEEEHADLERHPHDDILPLSARSQATTP